jgi:threonine synthase
MIGQPYCNIVCPSQRVSFPEAVKLGIGREQGLFMPESLERLQDVDDLLELGFAARSAAILSHLVGASVDREDMRAMVGEAFNFPVKLSPVSDRSHALELFHGTSLAFKDFGARFMAQCLARFHRAGPMTILTATSGDTGAACTRGDGSPRCRKNCFARWAETFIPSLSKTISTPARPW